MLNFRGTDTVSQGRKGSMSGCVRITANHGHSWQGRTLLRPDHVNNTLSRIVHFELCNTEGIAVLIQCFHLNA